MIRLRLKDLLLLPLLSVWAVASCCKDKPDTPEIPGGQGTAAGETYSFTFEYDGQPISDVDVFVFDAQTKQRLEIKGVQTGLANVNYTVALESDRKYSLFALANVELKDEDKLSFDEVKEMNAIWYSADFTGEASTLPLSRSIQNFNCGEIGADDNNAVTVQLNLPFEKIVLKNETHPMIDELFPSSDINAYISNVSDKVALFPGNTPYASGTAVNVPFVEESGSLLAFVPNSLYEQVRHGAEIVSAEQYYRDGKLWAKGQLRYTPEEKTSEGKELHIGLYHQYDYALMRGIWYDADKHPDGYREAKTFAFLEDKHKTLPYNTRRDEYYVWLPGEYNPDGIGNGTSVTDWSESAFFRERAEFKTLTWGVAENFWFWDDFSMRCGVKCTKCGVEHYGYPYADAYTNDDRKHWLDLYIEGWKNEPNYLCPHCGALLGDKTDESDEQLLFGGKPGQTSNYLQYTEGRSMVKAKLPWQGLVDGESCPVWFEDKATGARDTVWVPVGDPEDMVFAMDDPHRIYAGQKDVILTFDTSKSIMYTFLRGENSVAKYSGGGGGGEFYLDLLAEGELMIEFKDKKNNNAHLGYFALKVKEPVIGNFKSVVVLK